MCCLRFVVRVRIRVSPHTGPSSRTAIPIVVSLTRVVSCQALWRVAGLARGLHRAIAMEHGLRRHATEVGAIWARRFGMGALREAH